MTIDAFIYEHHKVIALLLLALAFATVGLIKSRAASPSTAKESEK